MVCLFPPPIARVSLIRRGSWDMISNVLTPAFDGCPSWGMMAVLMEASPSRTSSVRQALDRCIDSEDTVRVGVRPRAFLR